jgi:hypothetical protein
MGGIGNSHNLVVGKHEVKRMVGRPRPSWKDNIKTNLKEVGCKEMG